MDKRVYKSSTEVTLGLSKGITAGDFASYSVIEVGGEQRAAVRNPRFEILFLRLGLFPANKMN